MVETNGTKYILTLALIAVSILVPPALSGNASGQAELKDIEAEHGYVRVGGDQLFYDLAGEGRSAVLLHDELLHRVTWDGQFAALAERFETLRYDRRGYGRSTRPREPYSDVDDLLTMLDSLRIESATLIGCSSGGGLAIDFALKYPERVDALVLVGAVVSGVDSSEHFLTRGGRWKWTEDMPVEDVIEYWTMVDPYEISSRNAEVKERAKRMLVVSTQNLDPETQRLRQPPERPAASSLAELVVPILIIVGEYDIPDVHAHAGAIEVSVPDAWRAVISGVGHMVHLEAPGVFNELVLDFLRELEQAEAN